MASIRTHTVATAAYETVRARAELPADQRKQYGALAHKLPGLILQNGLAQATGFLVAKGANSPAHIAVLDDLHRVLHATRTTNGQNGRALHQEIIAADLPRTMLLTRRALEAGGWIKRYVQGVLRLGPTGEPEGQDEQEDGHD
jgi:CRISPR-associated protein Cmr5